MSNGDDESEAANAEGQADTEEPADAEEPADTEETADGAADQGSADEASDQESADAEESQEVEDAEESQETTDAEEDQKATESAESEADTDSGAGEDATDTAETTELSADTLDQRLTDAEADLEAAETEPELDEVEAELDAIEEDIEAAEFPESPEGEGEDGGEGEDETEAGDPKAELEERLSDLRDQLEEKRGPYTEDVIAVVEEARDTVADTRWTEDGHPDVVDAVENFLKTAAEELDTAYAAESEDADDLAATLDDVVNTLESVDLDPDDDAATIETLLEAAETLTSDLQSAETWDDLSVRQQLDAQGFYDVLESENRKDFPPEWNAIKIYEKMGDPEPILLGLETFDSDFMEENILDTLVRMAPAEAYDQIHQRAQKRNKKPVQILGKIGDERATETLHDFIDGDGDPVLQKITLRALGEIGSEESTQPVANRLDADNYEVRSSAARSLGLLGDTRAIDPLSDVLENDEFDEVRASAAWALNQIGTQRALDVLEDYADDRSYIVQSEAQKAV